jgi:hypothetical protein
LSFKYSVRGFFYAPTPRAAFRQRHQVRHFPQADPSRRGSAIGGTMVVMLRSGSSSRGRPRALWGRYPFVYPARAERCRSPM